MIDAMIGRAFLILFAVFWTAIVCIADFAMGHGIVDGLRAEYFDSTAGTVTHSEVTRHSGRRGGVSYGVDIRYSYVVNGQTLEGTTYRYATSSSSPDAERAQEVVRAHRVGSPVTVYYDAADPSASVLRPGVDGADLFSLLFLAPFNIVMLAVWRFGCERLWHWWHGTKPKLVIWTRAGDATRVRMSNTTAFEGGVIAGGAAAFAIAFVTVFTLGLYLSVSFVLALWALALSAGVAAGLWIRGKELAGVYDFVVGDRTVDLPAMFDRKRRETLDRPTIAGVAVKAVERPGRRSSTTV